MMNNKLKKTLTFASKIAFNVCMVIFGLTMVGTTVFTGMLSSITVDVENTIIEKVKHTKEEIVDDEDGSADTEYFKSDYKRIAHLRAVNNNIGLGVESEGIVMLKNADIDKPNVGKKPTLPLSKGNKVNLYSMTSFDPIYGVRGAGGIGTAGGIVVDADQRLKFKDVLENSGLDVNDDLDNWYRDNYNAYKRTDLPAGGSGNSQLPRINDASWAEITTNAKETPADAAIFVLGRLGNENIDMPPYKSNTGSATALDDPTLNNKDYLKLTTKEIDVLTNLKAQKDAGTFKSIILLINSANPILDNVIDNAAYGIDAALWIGMPGTSGLHAVGDIMIGDVTPSGRMADMWYEDKSFNPTLTNWGEFKHDGRPYVVYQEGIYLGYRYAETRYEDKIMERDKVGDFDYDEAIMYPFGYGLSYTNFTYSDFKVTAPAADATAKDDKYTVSVKVTNSGNYAGKEVVQIYLQQPYTDYDITNQIEKSAVDLVGFAKTAKLKAGEEEVVTIQVEGKYFASFDARGAGTYYLDKGDYYLTAGKDAHDATNNILAKKGKTVAAHGMDKDGNAALVEQIVIAQESATKYANASNEGVKVDNIFDASDPNLLHGNENVKFMTRSDWNSTVKFGWDAAGTKLNNQVLITNSTQIQAGYDKDNNRGVATDTGAYPTYGKEANLNLIQMRAELDGTKIAYDDERWNTFLDQLTWDETVMLLSNGLRRTIAIPSIAKPATIDHNGPSGFSEKYGAGLKGLARKNDDPDKELHPTGYPSANVIASTFNIKLAEAVGEAIGEDALWLGNSGMYGLGINSHRSPYHGRFAEYYSEDAYLTGVIAGYQSKGIWSKGCYVYSKHLVLNEQEHHRVSHEAWITEQALRQNYLRQYELCIEIGDAMNVMTSFNRLGSTWSGNNKNLCTDFLRTEAGMRGFAITDWFGVNPMGLVGGVLAGNDLPDGDDGKSPGAVNDTTKNQFNNMQTNHSNVAWAMRESAHRILYTVAHSNAMNGLSAGSKIIIVEYWTEELKQVITKAPKYIIGVDLRIFNIATGVLFGISAIFMFTMIGFSRKKQ